MYVTIGTTEADMAAVQIRPWGWAAGGAVLLPLASLVSPLSAPGWAVHNHASNDEPVYELTIQDSPLNIAMDSLMWQEDLKHPPRMLGSSHGFDTNRAKVA